MDTAAGTGTESAGSGTADTGSVGAESAGTGTESAGSGTAGTEATGTGIGPSGALDVLTPSDVHPMAASLSTKSFSPLRPRTEITVLCKAMEVAASPSANRTILAVEEAGVDEGSEVEDEHTLLLLALPNTDLSVLGSLGLGSSRALGGTSSGNTIRFGGTEEGTKTSAW